MNKYSNTPQAYGIQFSQAFIQIYPSNWNTPHPMENSNLSFIDYLG